MTEFDADQFILSLERWPEAGQVVHIHGRCWVRNTANNRWDRHSAGDSADIFPPVSMMLADPIFTIIGAIATLAEHIEDLSAKLPRVSDDHERRLRALEAPETGWAVVSDDDQFLLFTVRSGFTYASSCDPHDVIWFDSPDGAVALAHALYCASGFGRAALLNRETLEEVE